MERQYVSDWSQALERPMEFLRFGSAGRPVLAFPTSQGRFYQWEDFGLVEALTEPIESGRLSLWCVDSVDGESWYANDHPPHDRVRRHIAYERYLLDELLPRMGSAPIATGTSFGAFHAVLLGLRHPDRLSGWLGMSGVYDNSRWLDGYHDDETYLTNPLAFLPGLHDERCLAPLRRMSPLTIVTGHDDANREDSVKLGQVLEAKGVGVKLEIWDGWAHDWPYWKEMCRVYLA
jgi:esterase/lipase superfamily enzyme